MNTARVQVFQRPGASFEMREIELPRSLAPGEVLVEISLATVCGSDLHTFSGRRGAPTPCVLGHEAVGRVVASARPSVAVGERVTWCIADSCGDCAPCVEWGLPQKCTRLFKYGHAPVADGTGLNGCYASHITLRAGTAVLPVPDELPDSVVTPANCALATIVNALAELPKPCSSALVQGSGLLGIYACAWLRHRGVARVYCADVNPARLEIVAEFGGTALDVRAECWTDSRDRVLAQNPGGVDLALEVAGMPEVVAQGIELLRPGGMYVWAGMVHPSTSLDMTGESVLRKCLTIRGVHNYAAAQLAESLQFLQASHSHLPYDKLVSPPMALEELNEAFTLAQSREWLRVAVQP